MIAHFDEFFNFFSIHQLSTSCLRLQEAEPPVIDRKQINLSTGGLNGVESDQDLKP